MMNTVLKTAFIGALLWFGTTDLAHAGPGGKPPAMAFMHTLRDLSLTDTQKQQVGSLLGDFAAARMLEAHPDDEAQQNTLMTLSEEELITQVQSRFSARLDSAFEMASLQHDIYQLLNDTQRQQLVSVRDDPMMGRKKHRRPPFPAEELSLSEEQKASIAALRQEQEETHEAFADVMADFKAAEKALVYSDAFSYEQWLSELEPYRARLLDLAVTRARNKHAMLNVLTEQQQQLLQTIMATKGDKPPHRHRRG